MSAFAELGLLPALLQGVEARGYQQPTPIQAATIPAILAGRDLMAGAQTGTGKTAAFALPLLQLLSATVAGAVRGRLPQVLVLAPTRELAQQVQSSFDSYGAGSGLQSVLVYGGASIEMQVKALRSGADIVVATPGRLLDLLNRGAVTLSAVRHLVFDEADRMLDMGFMDEIRALLKQLPHQRQTLLFSATFGDEVFKLSKTLLQDPLLIEVDARNTVASQVEQVLYAVDPERKRELVSHLIGARNWQQVLIFTRTKQGADLLASEMNKDGLKVQAIHGDKSQGARERALEAFRNGELRALVATDLAARGLDIQQLQYVINFELPFNPEDYIHRIGRTGRAGNAGLAISLVSEEEHYLLQQIERVLDAPLVPQWLPGYEPDLTREVRPARKVNRGTQKRRARDQALGKNNYRRR